MDINNDGLQDVFFTATVGNDALYLNKGNMVFEDITKSAGVQKMQGTVSSGISYGDVNQDGYLDIYVSTFGYSSLEDEKRNRLYINNGDLTFTESAKAYGVDNGGYTVQSAFFDYDNDGDLEDLSPWNNNKDDEELRSRRQSTASAAATAFAPAE